MATRPDDEDIKFAQERDFDQSHERDMLKKAELESFWSPLTSNWPSNSATLLHEWAIARSNRQGSVVEFSQEGDAAIRCFCEGLLRLLQAASPDATPEQKAGVDIALIILDAIATDAPDSLDIFRDYAQEAYEQAKVSPVYLHHIQVAKRYVEIEQNKTDAFNHEVSLFGKQDASRAFTLDGEVDGQPSTFPEKDLNKYGMIHDHRVYSSLHHLLTLHGASAFQQRKAVRVICALLAKNVHPLHPIHQYTFHFLTSSIPFTTGNGVISLLDGLRVLLTNRALHRIFISHNGVKILKGVLQSEAKQVQALYLAGYSLWLLSYNPENDLFLEQWTIVDALAGLLRTITRDKVIRITLLFFVNVLQRREFVTLLIGSQFHKLLPVLQARKWNDKDIVTNITIISEAVSGKLNALSTFDVYIAELKSGSLKRSPVHSERFWRANAIKFDSADPQEEHLRKLIAFVKTPAQYDVDCLEMAAYDLGEFARFHPDGKRILTRLEAKQPLMALMNHSEPAVTKAALLATQKLLIHKWDEMLQANKAIGLKA